MNPGPSRTRTWNSSFVLDEAKLIRICDVIEQQAARAGGQVSFLFTTTLKNGTAGKQLSIADLTRMDNATKNPVRSLLISAEQTGAPSMSTRVEFNSRQEKNITLDVQGVDSVAISEVFAAVEEQVERTLEGAWPQIAALLCLLGVLLFSLLYLLPSSDPAGTSLSLLSRHDLQDVVARSQSVSDEKAQVAWMFDVLRRQVVAQEKRIALPSFSEVATLANVARWAPVFVSILLLLFLSICCYPRAVFSWGDHSAYFAKVLERRKFVWNTIFAAIVLGLIVNLAAAAYWDAQSPSK